jgi:hypothetical protein
MGGRLSVVVSIRMPLVIVIEIMIMIMMIVIAIVGDSIDIRSWRKRNAAENLAKASRLNRRELFVRGKAGCGQVIGDRDQLVWIGALVAVSANG